VVGMPLLEGTDLKQAKFEQIKHARIKLKEGLDAEVADINKTYALVVSKRFNRRQNRT
jgi:hypothetical protein